MNHPASQRAGISPPSAEGCPQPALTADSDPRANVVTTAGRYLTVPEVATLLKVSKTTIYRLVETRKLAFYRVLGQLRFDLGDVEDYLSTCRAERLTHDDL